MTVGFTGTQYGMSWPQKNVVRSILQHSVSPDPEAHAGDCIGADVEFQEMVWQMGFNLVLHPPTDTKKRAFFSRGDRVTILPPREYMLRNQDIVDACHLLIAAPFGEEQRHPRSGTWATIRKAVRAKKRVVIVDAKGNIEYR